MSGEPSDKDKKFKEKDKGKENGNEAQKKKKLDDDGHQVCVTPRDHGKTDTKVRTASISRAFSMESVDSARSHHHHTKEEEAAKPPPKVNMISGRKNIRASLV